VNRRLALIAALVVLGAGWGITNPLSKIAVSQGYRHFGLIFWQLVIGTAVLAALTLIRGRPLGFTPRQLGFCTLIALTGTLIPNAASYAAVVHLPAGIMSITIAAVPMFAFPIALVMGTDRFGWARLAGLLAGLGGVVLLTAPEASLPDPGLAIFVPLALIAPLMYGLEGNLVAKWGMAGLGPVRLLLGASLTGLPVAGALALATGTWIDPRPPWGGPDWALIASSTLHALVYSGYVWLVGRAGATFAAQVSYLVTGSGILWAMALLGESYSGWVWAALGLMFIGLFLVQPRES
jgi:drug/metabolite transporter (DMT)-like permease